HRLAQIGQALGEADELVEFLLLLASAELGVVQILAPAGRVDARRLELRGRARRDPDVLPRRRNHELADSRELRRVRDDLAPRVEIAKGALTPLAAPPSSPCHASRVP